MSNDSSWSFIEFIGDALFNVKFFPVYMLLYDTVPYKMS